jgi:hypothetical protein
MRAWVFVLLASCGGSADDAPRTDRPRAQAPAQSPPVPLDPATPTQVTVPDFPEGTQSLVLTRTIGVRLEPGDTAKRIGTVAIDTRVGWVRTEKAKGCSKPWVEIKPRGWICSDYVRTSARPPFGREVPHLDRGELVPGVYGKVTLPTAMTYVFEKPDKKDRKDRRRERPRGPVTSTREVAGPPAPKLIEARPLVGSVNVRQFEEITVENKQYWKISQKDPEYVLRTAILQHRPSLYGGTRLSDDTGWSVPIAFVWPRVVGWGQASTMYNATGVGGVARQVPMRTPIPLLETHADKAGKPISYRIGPTEWIWAPDVRIFTPAPPPALLAFGERWIDVDLDSQILVAYEGTLPVYATMVSSGAKDTPTVTGLYRMWLKESEADMKGLNGEDPYSVATVPWTQFFSPENELALHTAYWHDQFGVRRSHGCVNLAPRDARWLYFWSDPQVPPGWTMAAGVVEAPGSVVRIRTKEDPQPEWKGYARKVQEARQQNAPVN